MSLSFILALLLLPASGALSIPVAEAAPAPDLHTFASTTAQVHGLNPTLFAEVIGCESGWNPAATSTTADFGIAQIHISVHPEVSLAQADNPYWAIDWMATEWQAGNASWWSCYKKATLK